MTLRLILALCLLLSSLPSANAKSIKENTPCEVQTELRIVKNRVLICQLTSVGKKWTFMLNRKKLTEYETTKLQAYSEIMGALKSRNSTNAKLNFLIGNSFPKDLADLYKSQSEFSSKLFGSFFNDSEIINIYLYTEKEADFVNNFKIFSNSYDIDDRTTWFKRWKSGQGQEHNIGLAAFFMEYPVGVWQGHAGLMVYSGATKSSLRRYAIQVMPHEYFHVIQDYFFRKDWEEFKRANGKQNINGKDIYDTYFPPIFREGSANTISFALASNNATYYLDFYRYFAEEKKQVTNNSLFKKLYSESSVVESLKSMEFRNSNPEAHEASYMIGQLVFEWFIAKYGFSTYEKLIKNQLTGNGFEDNLMKSAGITLKQLYEGAAPHIVAAFK